MAFLDNSGDIILDAVLTDAGRQRMARGEFKIVKFAFSDEEINYESYKGSHPSGSAFADLEIMQTPILEAFTNNTSLMKTKLVSLNRNNILYMPIFRLNHKEVDAKNFSDAFEGFYLSADSTTDEGVNFGSTNGMFPSTAARLGDGVSRYIIVDQGMDTSGVPPITEALPSDLVETAFLIRVDDRLVQLHGSDGASDYPLLSRSFVDDDAIATYYISSTSVSTVAAATRTVTDQIGSINYTNRIAKEMFDGPLGTRLRLMVQPSPSIKQSQALFDELGSTGGNAAALGTTNANAGITTSKIIDTTINIVGVTTGYSIDIPLRIVKKLT
jgi:hypothetical protein